MAALSGVPAGAWAYEAPLVEATWLRRYKRFFVDVALSDGEVVTAHCANTGAMTGCDVPGAPCRVAPAGPGRKLAWRAEQVCVGGAWTMVHTARPNAVVEAALRAGTVPALAASVDMTGGLRREVAVPGTRSRADLCATDADGRRTWVEVKNVTLFDEQGVASFPDAVSARATEHLAVLQARVAAGDGAVLVLHVARAYATAFRPAVAVDTTWSDALHRAHDHGVAVLALRCEVTPRWLRLLPEPVPWPQG